MWKIAKTKLHNGREEDIKAFFHLTWEVVRRNQEYRENYIRFFRNYDLTPEDVRPKKVKNGSPTIPWHAAKAKHADCDPAKGRWLWDAEEPSDPEHCNLNYMMQKWGFACDPDDPTPHGSYWFGNFTSKEILKL